MRPVPFQEHKFKVALFSKLIGNIPSSELPKQGHQFGIHHSKQLNKTVACIEQLNMTGPMGNMEFR